MKQIRGRGAERELVLASGLVSARYAILRDLLVRGISCSIVDKCS